MEQPLIVRVLARLLIPLILLFALYVQFHGDYGPGGGFQAGVIFAAGFILHALVFGLERSRQVLPPARLPGLAALGVLLYTLTGAAGILGGGLWLDYGALLPGQPLAAQHLGIMLVEAGVGLTVASTMLLLFHVFASS